MKQYFLILLTVFLFLQSCKNDKVKEPSIILKEIAKTNEINIGNLNFQFDLPQEWYRLDTTLQGVHLCLLMNNNEIYRPRINVTTESMHGKTHHDYVLGTKEYLANNMTGIELLEDGQFEVSGMKCIWYTYNKTQNGMTREMIYYSISESGISYNITAGLNPGGLKIYRQSIDEIVKTFRLRPVF